MFPFSEQRTGRALAGLSIACLLLCDGVFGALHLLSGPLAASALAGEHVVHHGPTGEHDLTGNGDYTEQHHVDAAYFAVLFGFLVGGVLCLLANARWWCRVPVPRLVGSFPPAVVSNLPRGPTAPLLQVFRL